MSEIVGSASIEVDAKTDQFARDIAALGAAARALGKQIADDVTQPLEKKVRATLTKVKAQFRSWESSVSSSVRSAATKIATYLTPMAQKFQSTFRKARDSIDEFIVGSLAPFKAQAKRTFDQVSHDAQFAGLVVKNAAKEMRSSINKLITTALTPLKNRAKKAWESVSFWSEFGAGVSRGAVKEANRAFNDFLSNTVTGRVLARAATFTSRLGKVLKTGTELALLKGRLATLRGLDAVKDQFDRMSPKLAAAMTKVNAVVSAGFSKMSATFGLAAIKTRIQAALISSAAKESGDGLNTLPAKAKAPVSAFERIMKKAANSIRNSWLRMDSTVRAVVLSILVAGAPLATVFSGLSAGLVGIVAAAAGALAALSSLAGVVPALALGVGLAVAGLKDLSTYSTAAKASLDAIKTSFMETAVPEFMAQWTPALEKFLGLVASIDLGPLAASIGAAFSQITNAFSGLLESGAFTGFMGALEGGFSTALGNIGAALAPLIEAFMSFLTAAAPYAVQLSDMFLAWATNLAAVWEGVGQSAAFTAFMDQAIIAVQNLMDILGTAKSILSTVFQAGIGPGNNLLSMLGDMLHALDDFFKSPEGQDALANFFDKINTVLPPLFDLVGATGKALASLITPDIVASIGSFLGAISSVMPILAQIISVLANAQIVEVFAAAIGSIGTILEPLAGPLSDFVSTIATSLMEGLVAIQPFLDDMGVLLGKVLEAVVPLIPVILDLVFSALAVATPALEALMPILDIIIELFTTLADPLEELMPVIVDLMKLALKPTTVLLQVLTPVIQIVADVLSLLITVVVKAIVAFVDFLKSNEKVQTFVKATSDAIDTFVGWLTTARDWVGKLVDKFLDWFKKVDLGKWFSDAWEKVKKWFDDVLQWFSDLPGNIGKFFKNLGDTISAPFKDAFNAVKDAWNNTVGKLSWTVPDWIPGIGGNTFSAPKFAAGTIATKPTLGIFGEAGKEAVVPLDRPLSQVNPDVRWLSAIAQGKASPATGTSGGVTIAEGAFQIVTPHANPALVAEAVVDRVALSYK